MNQEQVIKNTIYSIYVGSTAYGTNVATSDMDEGGVCIPTKESILGNSKFEQWNNWTDEDGNKIDKTIYNIQKAVKLMIQNNPNMMDYLYVPERCIISMAPEWERIMAIRDDFLSTKCKHTYQGYSFAQLDRIKTHRAYLLSPVTKPNREDYGLPEVSVFPSTQYDTIAKLSTDFIEPEYRNDFYKEMVQLFDTEAVLIFRKYMSEDMIQVLLPELKKAQKRYLHTLSSISDIYLKEEYLGMASKELAYLAAYTNWRRYKDWEDGRNPSRKLLEAKCGYDSKHAMHLIRLAKMSVEILSGKGIIVDRTNVDREELLAIRNGEWKFDDVLALSDKLNKEADELYTKSTLPRMPNVKLIESTTMDIIERFSF